MEDLNKNQIILLTLLVSFVTSIATGIMTVSLLQEAPVEVTRNINRIVEKTIETVVPSTVTSPNTTKEVTTVVVKEEDQIIESINKNIKSIVRIKEKDGLTSAYSFYGIGMVVSKDGIIATDRRTITTTNGYIATMSDGTELSLTPLGVDKQTNFIAFRASLPEKVPAVATKPAYVFIPVTFASSQPKLGQTVISLGGDISNGVSVGRVVSLEMKESGTGTTSVKYLYSIQTDIISKDQVPGSPLFNLSGDVVGINLGGESSKIFISSLILKKELSSLTEPSKSQ